jgi:hypothetical protein
MAPIGRMATKVMAASAPWACANCVCS